MSSPILALLSLIYHIIIISFTKLSLVFLSDNSKKIIRDKTWDLTLKLDKLKVKPWLKKIRVVEPIFKDSTFRIPTKTINILAFFTLSIIYYRLCKYYVFNEEGFIINKDYFIKIRIVAYTFSFFFLSLVIRFIRRFLNKIFTRDKFGNTLLSIITFLIYWKVSSNIIGLPILLIIYFNTGEIDCDITKFHSLDCNPLFGDYNLLIQGGIAFLGVFAISYLTTIIPKIFGYVAYSIVYLYVTITSLILNAITFILYKISDYKSSVLKGHIIVFTALIEIITLIYLLFKN